MFRKNERAAGPVAGPQWSEWLDILADYRSERGHTNVDPYYITVEGKWLGGWLLSCRREYAAGTLPAERADELRALGVDPALDPGREPEPPKPDQSPEPPRARPEPNWDIWLAQVVAFRDANGHTNIHGHYVTPTGQSLGAWLARVRKSYRDGTLQPGLAEALAAVDYDVTITGRRPTKPHQPTSSWKPAGW